MLFLRPIVFVCLILALIFGIYLNNVNESLSQSNQCRLINNTCTFFTESMNLHINFLQTPIIEEELLINFDISRGNHIINAWVEGANMYMGKTPVIFEHKSGNKANTGITFLGSCTQADMQWQLFIEVKNKAEKIEIYSASFSTYQ